MNKLSKKKLDQSFGPEKRIKKRSDFLNIQSSGKKFKTKNFLFICKDSIKPRLGITVTTKVHKHAVVRNKVKRRIREIYRKLYEYIIVNQDVVIIAYQDAIELDYLDIKKEINYAFKKLGILHQKNN